MGHDYRGVTPAEFVVRTLLADQFETFREEAFHDLFAIPFHV